MSLNVPPETTTEYAYRALRGAIATGELKAGHRVVQREWADRLNISVTPVREALNRLTSEGLITVEAHRGATVIGLRLADAEEIYRLRMIVEPLLIEPMAASYDAARSAAWLEYCRQMDSTRDPVEFSELNQRFHASLAEGLSGWTAFTAAQLRMAAAPYVAVTLRHSAERLAESNRDHYLLVDSLATGDVAGAREVTIKHLQDSLDLLRSALA